MVNVHWRKVVSALGLSLVLLAIVGCGQSQSLPDIDATVEAMIKSAVEATVQSVIKSEVESTTIETGGGVMDLYLPSTPQMPSIEYLYGIFEAAGRVHFGSKSILSPELFEVILLDTDWAIGGWLFHQLVNDVPVENWQFPELGKIHQNSDDWPWEHSFYYYLNNYSDNSDNMILIDRLYESIGRASKKAYIIDSEKLDQGMWTSHPLDIWLSDNQKIIIGLIFHSRGV